MALEREDEETVEVPKSFFDLLYAHFELENSPYTHDDVRQLITESRSIWSTLKRIAAERDDR